MRVNKIIKSVPLFKKGEGSKFFKKRLWRRMWYIGKLYRLSKGQQFHTKFIRRFWAPHLLHVKISYNLFKYLYYHKLFTQRCAFNLNIDFYGNVDRFYLNYTYTDFDGNFQYISKSFLKKVHNKPRYTFDWIFLANGCTFITTTNQSPFELERLEEELFTYKGASANFWGYLVTASVISNFDLTFCDDTQLYFFFEVYKSLILICLMNTINK